MTSRRIRLFAVVVILSVCLLAVGATQPAANSAAPGGATTAAAAVKAAQGWVFEGCWTYWPAGPCRDVYRDSQGGYWLCRACGTTGTPSNKVCSRTSIQTLNVGYWCS